MILYDTLSGLPGGPLVGAFIIFIVLSIVSEVVLLVVIKAMERASRLTSNTLDDRIVEILKKHKNYYAIATSAVIALFLVYGNMIILQYTLFDITVMLFLLIGGHTLISIIDAFMVFYIEEIAPKTSSTIDDEIMPMARNIIKATLYVLLSIILLSKLGIEIGPLITGLGIAGLAVALAVQDTLSNFFAGIHILADRPIHVGDYIKIGDIEGYVEEIGWRSSRIRTLGNIAVIIPNQRLIKDSITNFSFYKRGGISHVVKFGVAYGTDVDDVKKAIESVLSKMEKEGVILKEPKPWYRMDNLSDFSVDFKVGYRVKSFLDRYRSQGVFYELLYRELNKRGIEIPFPTQTIYLKENKKEEKKRRSKKK